MPTSATTTWTNVKLEPAEHADLARTINVALKASQNLARGTVLGQVTATGKWAAYSDAAVDGLEVARGILPYDVQVDANGKITLSSTAAQSGGDQGETLTTLPVYVSGFFNTSELTGLDANGVADLGRLVRGTTADGLLQM